MKRSLMLVAFAVIPLLAILYIKPAKQNKITSPVAETYNNRLFKVQSIDTMKYSRDVAREKQDDETYDVIIDNQVRAIAQTGATHVAIGTPYEEEFVPFMTRWVNAARRHDLNVWFRGNLAGWEGWFDYPPMDRETHTAQVVAFILDNPDLFEDDDIFSSCPECENGGPGDPRETGDVEAYKAFLIDEYQMVNSAFDTIGKDVATNYYSMNGDVARLIMDRETTQALDGVVTIDHYVATPEQLMTDIQGYIEQSGGKVLLGEFGVPIPDIHGVMTDEQQAQWIEDSLKLFVTEKNLIGLNYWVNRGGSTELWTDTMEPKKGAEVLRKYFKPTTYTITIENRAGNTVENVQAQTPYRSFSSSGSRLVVPILGDETVVLTKEGYHDLIVQLKASPNDQEMSITMQKIQENWWEKIVNIF